MNIKKTPHGTIHYENDVVTVIPDNSDNVDLEALKTYFEECVKFADHKRFYFIIDLRRIVMQSTPESRKFYASNPWNKYRLADALVVKSPAQKILVNFFIQFNKPKVPTKTFTSMGAALAWIKQLKKHSKRRASVA